MELEDIQILAGVISTLLFVSSNLPMRWKAYLAEEARCAFDTLGPLETATMERIMQTGQLTTQ